MPKEKPPSPSVMISARDLKDIIRDELYALQVQLGRGLPNELVKEIAKTIVNRALLSPR
jgi:hypothetical protein